MEPTTLIFVTVIAIGIEALLLFLIIKGATSSRELLENSNMQLNIAVQIALKNGVDESKLSKEIAKLDTAQFLAERAMFAQGKIDRTAYHEIQDAFVKKYPLLAANWR